MSQKTCLRETLYSLVGWGIGEDDIAGAILRVPCWPWGFFYLRAVRIVSSRRFAAACIGWQRWLFTGIGVAAALLILWMLKSHPGQKLFAFAMASILGGAIGNVLDRILYGYVVDFLDFHWKGWHFPAFNVADSAITLGAICLILDELMRVRRGR